LRIVTLIENLVYKKGLVAEHGLSLYIECDFGKILFDTGQSSAFLQNAQQLNVNIEEIDFVIISHGHYDHAGGLEFFLKKNKKAIVYIKEDAFLRKFDSHGKFIGIKCSPSLISGRIKYVTGIIELYPGVFIMPDIPIINKNDTRFGNSKDEFIDELYLAIIHNGELSIVSGCSHRGITNILNAATAKFNLPVNLVLGGFHTKDCNEENFKIVLEYFQDNMPKSLGVCHCTGIDKYAALKQNLNTRVYYNYTGTITEL
jgi:7,8-dihydropterin-6-yl-methyl-4-(beta-D-ribofuranosyl)aminobenzene 5'-phosphate synthase